MATDSSIVCSGVVFSSLMSEQFSYSEVQEGFLLGSTVEHTSTQICDADINRQTTTSATYISSYHGLDLLGCLYDSGWCVRQETIDNVAKIAAKNNQTIVGWYTKRCYSDSWDRIYLRERLVHMQLREKLGCPQLLFIVFNWRKRAPECALGYFISVCKDDKFVRVPMRVSNLGNTSSTDYKLDPPNPGLYQSPVLRNVGSQLKNIEASIHEATSLNERLQASAQAQLESLSSLQSDYDAKLKQLLTLRTVCYHNNIVPEFELPTSLEEEKENGHNEANAKESSPPIANGGKDNSEEKASEKQTKKSGSKTIKKTSPPSKEKKGVKSKSEDRQTADKIDDVDCIDSHMSKLSVTPGGKKTPAARKSDGRPPSASRKLNTVKSASSSPAGRSFASPNSAQSPGRKASSVGTTPRQSRSPSVGSAKRKINVETKPGAGAAEGTPDKQAKVWK